MHCFIDLTSTADGRERDLLDVLVEFQPDVRASTSKLLTVLNPDDFQELSLYGFDTRVVPLPPGTDAEGQESAVLAELNKCLTSDWLDDDVLVCSFRPSLRERVLAEPERENRVRFLDLRDVLRAKAGRVNPQPIRSWPDDVIPEDQAISLLLASVADNGRGLKQTGVRPALMRRDDRFRKDPERPLATDNPKIVSLLVDLARRQKLITVTGPENDPLIELTAAGRERVPLMPVRPVVSAPVPQVPVARMPVDAGAAPLLPSLNGQSVEGQRPSEMYLSLLKSRRFGPFQEVRAAVFDELHQLLEGRERLTVRTLLDRAVGKVRDDVEAARKNNEIYLIKNPEKNIPWGQVRSFLTVMITRCPILKNGDSFVTGRSKDVDHIVDGAVENWRVRLDAELIVLLLESGCTLDAYSYEDLAGALFNYRGDITPVQNCIAYLIESGKCEEEGDQLTLRLVS